MLRRAWELAGDEVGASRVAVIAVGSVERHGDHLPVGTDAIEAEWVAERLAEELGADLFPPIWYGVSPALAGYRGTINVSQQALELYASEVLRELARNGYELIVVVNGHAGNDPALAAAIKDAASATGATLLLVDWWRDAASGLHSRLFTSPGHAGEDETSAMLYIDGEHVRMERARPHEPGQGQLSAYLGRIYSSLRVESPRLDGALYHPVPVVGDPTKASAEKGRQWLEAVVRELADRVRELMEAVGLGQAKH